MKICGIGNISGREVAHYFTGVMSKPAESAWYQPPILEAHTNSGAVRCKRGQLNGALRDGTIGRFEAVQDIPVLVHQS